MSAAAQEVAAQPLQLSRMKEGQYARNVFSVTVPNNVTIADIVEETYWQHVARNLRLRDRIEVMPDNGEWFVELMVTSVGKLHAGVAIMRENQFTTPEIQASEASAYEIKYAGPHVKYQVIKNGVVVADSFDTEQVARRWVTSHIEAIKN